MKNRVPLLTPSKLEAVLCDLDGTLVDSNPLHAEAWKRTFEHIGIAVSFEQALHQIGKGGDQLIPVFVQKRDLRRLTQPIKEYRKKLFETTFFSKVKEFPSSRELLVRMKSAGLRVAVASSASKKDLVRLKGIAGITDLVDEETSSDDAECSKPSPDMFLAALDRLQVKAAHAIAPGDTPWDIQAAGRAGVATVAVTSGGWTEAQLLEAGALEAYESVDHMARNFERSAFFLGG